MKQNLRQQLLFREYLDPIKLQKGNQKCPCCGKRMVAFWKSLDDRLVEYLHTMAQYNKKVFRLKVVLGTDEALDAQKLGYWGLIEKVGSSSWKISDKGWSFLEGRSYVPKRLLIFNKQVIDTSEERANIDGIEKRWQKEKLDYTLDSTPVKPPVVRVVEREGQLVAVMQQQ